VGVKIAVDGQNQVTDQTDIQPFLNQTISTPDVLAHEHQVFFLEFLFAVS